MNSAICGLHIGGVTHLVFTDWVPQQDLHRKRRTRHSQTWRRWRRPGFIYLSDSNLEIVALFIYVHNCFITFVKNPLHILIVDKKNPTSAEWFSEFYLNAIGKQPVVGQVYFLSFPSQPHLPVKYLYDNQYRRSINRIRYQPNRCLVILN